MPHNFTHEYSFDPSYGFNLHDLDKLKAKGKPRSFSQFWQRKYQAALTVNPYVSIQDTGRVVEHWRIFDCYYDSTKEMRIGGWLLLPEEGEVKQGIVYGHGYGGLSAPDTSIKLSQTALLFPCFRGIGRSLCPPISNDPQWHVLHNIQDKEKYIIGECVQDIWCGVTALINLFPQIREHIGYIGSSFGGGLGIFATAFDPRIKRSHFHVPTFGNTKLRLELPTVGSGESLRQFYAKDPDLLLSTIRYFDAAFAAEYIQVPTQWALALFDPFVAPPGQFSAYNHVKVEKSRVLLDAGHFEYEQKSAQSQHLRSEMESFFNKM